MRAMPAFWILEKIRKDQGRSCFGYWCRWFAVGSDRLWAWSVLPLGEPPSSVAGHWLI